MNTSTAIAMVSTFRGFGIRFENVSVDSDGFAIRVSVPEQSELHNVHGSEMSGEVLARRCKECLEDAGLHPCKLWFRVRSGENWTRDMQIETEMHSARDLVKFADLLGFMH